MENKIIEIIIDEMSKKDYIDLLNLLEIENIEYDAQDKYSTIELALNSNSEEIQEFLENFIF